MPRLIDANKLEPIQVYRGDVYCEMVFMADIDNAPTIDAIPIEWIKEWVNNYCDRYEEGLFECLLRTWNKNGRGEKEDADIY